MPERHPRNIWFTSANVAMNSNEKVTLSYFTLRTNQFSFWADIIINHYQQCGRIHCDIKTRFCLHVFYYPSWFGDYSPDTFVVEYRGYGLTTSRKYVPNLPVVLRRMTVVRHLTKPSSRQHLGFLGVSSDTDTCRKGFLLQLDTSHAATTKGCCLRVESDLHDLGKNCLVCCELLKCA